MPVGTPSGLPPVVSVGGVAGWKAAAISALLAEHGAANIPIYRGWRRALARAQRMHGTVAVWPSRVPADFASRAEACGVPVRRIEDGFIRSVGLGSDCTPPCSIVLDSQGLYYDARGPSDLEILLESGGFEADLLDRAERLRVRLVRAAIAKYEVGHAIVTLPDDGRRKVLVVGQVENDLSVLASGCGVAGNLDLLRRVREIEPDAMVIYRPHPDVEQGHRIGRVLDADARQYADVVSRDGTMASAIDAVDEVHVLTSQAGFEALMRGRAVSTHGHPFYAGWGLTRDFAGPVARRTRPATLTELVAATLILYPRYLDPLTGKRCTPEILVDRFAAPDYCPPNTLPMRFRRLQARLNRLLTASNGTGMVPRRS